MTFATVEDFQAEKQVDLDSSDIVTVERLLARATGKVLRYARSVGGTADWVTDEADPPIEIEGVVVEVAYRAWSNPDALSQASSADTSISYVRGGSPDAMFLTDEDKDTIREEAGGSSFRSVTLVSPWSGAGENTLLL